MRAILLMIMVFLLPAIAVYGKISFNTVVAVERQAVEKRVSEFSHAWKTGDRKQMRRLLAADRVNLNGSGWVEQDSALQFMAGLPGFGRYSPGASQVLTLDDCLNDTAMFRFAMPVKKIFDNQSLLVRFPGTAAGEASAPQNTMGLLFQKAGRENSWMITSVFGEGGIFPAPHPKYSGREPFWKIEKIADNKLEIKILRDFRERKKIGNKTIFVLPVNNKSAAVFQVYEKVYIGDFFDNSYDQIKLSLQKIDYGEFKVKLFENGLRYEYDFRDENGLQVKGVSVALRRQNRMVLVIFYAIKELYDRILDPCDFTLENLTFVE